jgi:cobalt/nickel transport system permease protein
MFDEPFASKTSCIHKLDPRIRALGAVFSIVCMALLQHRQSALYGLFLAVFLFFLSKPPLKIAFQRILVVNIFILFLWLTVPFSMGGATLTQIGPMHVSRQGVELAELLTLKSNAIVLLFLTLITTMNVATLGKALYSLHCPVKLVFLLLFTYRYIHVVFDEWQKLWIAAKLRAFVPKSNLHSYKVFANMLGMSFVQSFERSGRVYEAMLLRGFSGRFLSTDIFKATVKDSIFLILLCVLAAIIFAFDYFNRGHIWG